MSFVVLCFILVSPGLYSTTRAEGNYSCLSTALPVSSLGVKCIPGVGKFSSSVGAEYFHYCDEASQASGGPAELRQCPPGRRYHRGSATCVDSQTAGLSQPYSEKTMGRPTQLGSLYDATTGLFFPEASLWSRDTVTEHTVVDPIPNPGKPDSYTADTRAWKKFKHFDIDVSLTLGYMGKSERQILKHFNVRNFSQSHQTDWSF